MNLVDEIIAKLNSKYNGKLDCEEQRADLFVYINGQEETIAAVDAETIYFKNEEYNVSLYDADIQHLAYINEIL